MSTPLYFFLYFTDSFDVGRTVYAQGPNTPYTLDIPLPLLALQQPVLRVRNKDSWLPHPTTRRGDADYKAQQAYEMTVITHMATHGRRHQSVSGQDPFGPLEVRRVPQVYFLPLLYGELTCAPPTMQCPLGKFSDQPPPLWFVVVSTHFFLH